MKRKKGFGGRPKGASKFFVAPLSMHRLMKSQTELLVSKEAPQALSKAAEVYAREVVLTAEELAKQRESGTIKVSDIELAARLKQ